MLVSFFISSQLRRSKRKKAWKYLQATSNFKLRFLWNNKIFFFTCNEIHSTLTIVASNKKAGERTMQFNIKFLIRGCTVSDSPVSDFAIAKARIIFGAIKRARLMTSEGIINERTMDGNIIDYCAHARPLMQTWLRNISLPESMHASLCLIVVTRV